MKKLRYNSLLLLASLFVACQETYLPKDLDSSKKILVVNGLLSNNDGPHKVTLSYAIPFLESSVERVTGAKVDIIDGFGNSYELKEKQMGYYYTTIGALTGVPGNTYHLQIVLADGSTYESSPTKMPTTNSLSEVYAEPGEKGTLTQSSDGSYFENVVKGLNVYADFATDEPDKQYLRFENTIASQSVFDIDKTDPLTGMPFKQQVSCVDVAYSTELPNVKTTLLSNGRQLFTKVPLGFVAYAPQYKMVEAPVTDPPSLSEKDSSYMTTPAGWIINIDTYSIDKTEYVYWDKVRKQLEANNHIFDAIPSTLTGNIKNVNDDSESVFGYFSVSPKVTTSHGFLWTPRSTMVKHKIITNYEYQSPISFCNDSIIPPGWVYF